MEFQLNGYKIEAEQIVAKSDFKEYKKKLNAKAVQMGAPFKVDSKEGLVSGKAGDYLMMGVDGEMYICDKDIFEKSYEKVMDNGNKEED